MYSLLNGSDFNLSQVSVVPVQDVFVCVDDTMPYQEYNPSLRIISASDSFWETDEIEYKIETTEGELLRNIAGKEINRFQFSNINSFTTYERYYRCDYGQQTEWICILGKKNWKKRMAIKHKRKLAGSILKRHVNILPYTQERFVDYIEKLFGVPFAYIRITTLPVYYKKKERLICIDQDIGQLYGVSYSYSKPLQKSLDRLGEIEIEFWSRILPVGDKSEVDYNSYDRLIETLEKQLTTQYTAPGRTKVEWLNQLI